MRTYGQINFVPKTMTKKHHYIKLIGIRNNMDSVEKRDSMSFTTQSFIKGLCVNLKKVDHKLYWIKNYFFFFKF